MTQTDMILLSGGRAGEPQVLATGRHRPTGYVEIGSVTKTFTAALYGVMVDAGDLDPRAPLAGVLPGATSSTIRLQHLVHHTSGLPRLPPGVSPLRSDPYGRLDEAGFRALLPRLDELRRAPAGLRMRYSNFGYGVLGAALAAAAGTSWLEAVRTRVVAPLGLPDPVVPDEEVPPADRLAAVDKDGSERARWHLGPLTPAGGLWTTPRSLADYTRKVLLEHALGRPRGWQFSRGIDWHNGATRDSSAFVGARPATGAWAVSHALGRPPGEVDAMGLDAMDDGTPA